MSDEYQQETPEGMEKPALPVSTKAGVFMGSMATVGLVDLIAQGGLTGVVLGGIGAIALTKYSPEIAAYLREHNPIPVELRKRLTNRAPLLELGQDASMPDESEPAYESEFPDLEADGHQDALERSLPLHLIFPHYPANVTMRLGKVVSTRQRFDPHINRFLGDGAVIAGSPGAGKSNLLGLMATGAANCGMSVIVIDYKREFYTLEEVVPLFLRAGHPSFASEAGESYFSLTAETASDFADAVMCYGFLAVIDVPSYAGYPDDLAEAIAATLNALMDWGQAQDEANRLPCLVFVDEAHNFWPEERKLSAFSAMKKENFDALQSAHNRITTGGRSYGFTVVAATQRIANIAKWAIATLQIKVIMRHRELNDLKRCEQEAGDAANPAIVKALEQGQGIVIGLTDDPMIVQFDRQPARHVSVTPTIERVHEKRSSQVQPRISQILPRQAPAPRSSSTMTEEDLLHLAQTIYEPGVSHHDLARALGTDMETAIELLKLLKRLRVSTVSVAGNSGNSPETVAETGQQAGSKVITGIFANASATPDSPEGLSGELDTSTVSNDIRETIRRARNRKNPISHREVAGLVGLTGRSYKIYQQVCREMGLMSAAEAAEQ